MLRFIQQAFNREQLDFRIILVVPEFRFVTACVHGFVAHRFDKLFEREENSVCRFLVVHAAESRQGGIATSFRFTPPP